MVVQNKSYVENCLVETLKPFMVVSAPYIDFEGEYKKFGDGETEQRGLFLVFPIKDSNGSIGDNVLGFKITSQYSKYINEYCYYLPVKYARFLRTDSYVQFDKPHPLDVSKCRIIGSIVSMSVRHALFRCLDEKYYPALKKAMQDHISFVSRNYVSTNCINKNKYNRDDYNKAD